jgi:hypothetical protein
MQGRMNTIFRIVVSLEVRKRVEIWQNKTGEHSRGKYR